MNSGFDKYARCRWPDLPPGTSRALHAAVRYILESIDDGIIVDGIIVDGIVVAGSHISGAPDASSDLDIYVIHAAPWRQRLQKWFEGVPAEIFVNPPAAIRRYFAAEVQRPCTALMLATGFVVLEEAPVVQELRREAREWLHRPLELSETQLTLARYTAADGFDNARDVRERNPAAAARILNGVVDDMLDYAFLYQGKTLPRTKAYLDDLAELDSQLADVARRYYLTGDLAERFALADEIAARTVVEQGFFEWESPLEPIAPQTAQDSTDKKEGN